YVDRSAPFVPAWHRRQKEDAVLPVAHSLVQAVFPLAIIMWALDESHTLILEIADQCGEEGRPGLIVAVDQADDRCVRIGLGQGEVQSTGLGAGTALQVKEP